MKTFQEQNIILPKKGVVQMVQLLSSAGFQGQILVVPETKNLVLKSHRCDFLMEVTLFE
ncbi:hypothetical protein CLV48_103212 [Cecembia rubra]|uniref:Uncharacterized protein n=1 Tax=Cecembia rubra TaxID=1485585 RepID=A0A2P8E8G8_9BACT|nr:hypothetical protein CLV48_103212 [Cecembia rubra]